MFAHYEIGEIADIKQKAREEAIDDVIELLYHDPLFDDSRRIAIEKLKEKSHDGGLQRS